MDFTLKNTQLGSAIVHFRIWGCYIKFCDYKNYKTEENYNKFYDEGTLEQMLYIRHYKNDKFYRCYNKNSLVITITICDICLLLLIIIIIIYVLLQTLGPDSIL